MKIMVKMTVLAFSSLFLLFPPALLFGSGLKLNFVTAILTGGEGLGLRHPAGILFDRDDSFIVADTGNSRLLRYTYTDRNLNIVPQEIRSDHISYPLKIQMDSRANIYVLDGHRHIIVRLAPDGKYLGDLSLNGLPAQSGYLPKGFLIDPSDTLYVIDALSDSLLVLDTGGNYLKKLSFPKEVGFISDLAMDKTGKLLLLDSVRAVVFSMPPGARSMAPLSESLKQYLRFPINLTTDNMGRIYMVDRNGGAVIVLNQNGAFLGRLLNMGWKKGQLNYPSQLCISEKGDYLVADTGNHRIQIFRMVE